MFRYFIILSVMNLVSALLFCSSASQKTPGTAETETQDQKSTAVIEAKKEYEEYLKIKDDLEAEREKRRLEEERLKKQREQERAEIAAKLAKEEEQRLQKEREEIERLRRQEAKRQEQERQKQLEEERIRREEERKRQEELRKQQERIQKMDEAEKQFALIIDQYEDSVKQTQIDKRLKLRESVLDQFDRDRESFYRIDAKRRFGDNLKLFINESELQIYRGRNENDLNRFSTRSPETVRIEKIKINEQKVDLFEILPNAKGVYILTETGKQNRRLQVQLNGKTFIIRELFFDGKAFIKLYLESLPERYRSSDYYILSPEEAYLVLTGKQ